MEKRNVLVIGAGPSGVSAAFFLKALDKHDEINVTLVEKLNDEQYRKYQRICGEGISKRAFKELHPIKPQGIIERIKLIKDIYPGGIEFDIKMGGYLIDREYFLNRIIDDFQKLGGCFLQETAVGISNVEKKPTVDFLNGKMTVDYVIAADGANSTIRRGMGLKEGFKKAFIQCIVEGETKHDTLFFIYDKKYMGEYKWIFPNKGNTKIGFPFINNMDIDKEVGKRRILQKGARVIGYGGVDNYSYGRVLFVGDAAFQTNPLTKGGIRSGMIAGKYAAEALLQNKPERYQKLWKKSGYESSLYMPTFAKLERMNNKELTQIVNFMATDSDRYEDISNAFNLAHDYGW